MIQDWLIELGNDEKLSRLALFQKISGKVINTHFKQGFGALLQFLIDSFGINDTNMLQKIAFSIETSQSARLEDQ
jgi:hypothetical protein